VLVGLLTLDIGYIACCDFHNSGLILSFFRMSAKNNSSFQFIGMQLGIIDLVVLTILTCRGLIKVGEQRMSNILEIRIMQEDFTDLPATI
jgi:hypothetical protein